MILSTLSLRPGDTLDHYLLDSVVATSGMATVFRALDQRDGRQVAIKVPHPEVESDPVLFDRFRREEEIGIRLDHPHVMKVYANPDRSQVYMAMEWIDGRLLRSILNQEGRLPVERATRLAIQICETLEFIHTHGVAHRDLKPENIMVDAEDKIHLIDFGIAAHAGAKRLTFTHLSTNLGTPDYISPEQVRGKRGDARSDIFAMGCILYEMLTGSVPFRGENPFAVMNDRLLNHPVPPSRLEPAVTPQMQEIIYRALEREPRHRYASAREMAHDLTHQDQVGVSPRPDAERWETRRSPALRRNLRYAALALIPIVLFLLMLLLSRRR